MDISGYKDLYPTKVTIGDDIIVAGDNAVPLPITKILKNHQTNMIEGFRYGMDWDGSGSVGTYKYGKSNPYLIVVHKERDDTGKIVGIEILLSREARMNLETGKPSPCDW